MSLLQSVTRAIYATSSSQPPFVFVSSMLLAHEALPSVDLQYAGTVGVSPGFASPYIFVLKSWL